MPARARRSRFISAAAISSPESDPPAGVESSDAAGQVAPGHLLEAGGTGHFGENFLRRELADALHEVAVGLLTRSDEPPETRDDLKRVQIVKTVQHRHLTFRKLEACKAATRLQHAEGFPQRGIDVGDVADAERNRIGVEA